jgi:hypothetical protein
MRFLFRIHGNNELFVPVSTLLSSTPSGRFKNTERERERLELNGTHQFLLYDGDVNLLN